MECEGTIYPPTARHFIDFMRYFCYAEVGVILGCDESSNRVVELVFFHQKKEELNNVASRQTGTKYVWRYSLLNDLLFPIIKDAANFVIHRLILDYLAAKGKVFEGMPPSAFEKWKEKVTSVACDNILVHYILGLGPRGGAGTASHQQCMGYKHLSKGVELAIATHAQGLEERDFSLKSQTKINPTTNNLIECFNQLTELTNSPSDCDGNDVALVSSCCGVDNVLLHQKQDSA